MSFCRLSSPASSENPQVFVNLPIANLCKAFPAFCHTHILADKSMLDKRKCINIKP
jgi:hypothetical protein